MKIAFKNALFLITILFSGVSMSEEAKSINVQFQTNIRVSLGKPVTWDDGMTIRLESFSHKKVRNGEPGKAMAYGKIKIGGAEQEITFNRYGDSGNENIYIQKYFIEVKDFKYDDSLLLKVTSLPVREIKLNEAFTLKIGDVGIVTNAPRANGFSNDFLKIRALKFGHDIKNSTQTKKPYCDLEIFLDGPSDPYSTRLYDTGYDITKPTEPSTIYSGRRIQLKKIGEGYAELIVTEVK